MVILDNICGLTLLDVGRVSTFTIIVKPALAIPIVIYTSHLLSVPPGSASLEITVVLYIHLDIGSLQMIHYGMEKAALHEVAVADMRVHFTSQCEATCSCYN